MTKSRIDEDGCRLWTGYTNKQGYGVAGCSIIEGHKRLILVHRLAAWLWLDFDPLGPLFVLHRCDKRPCFNVNCLFIGTRQDNMDDMKAKGRQSRLYGDRNGRAKTTEAQRIQAVQLYATGAYSQRAIGELIGVSQVRVSTIVRQSP